MQGSNNMDSQNVNEYRISIVTCDFEVIDGANNSH